MLKFGTKKKIFTIILTIYVCKKLFLSTQITVDFRKVMKIDSKTGKWKSDCALERIKN